jgi:glucosamine-6-phosphate isomerase
MKLITTTSKEEAGILAADIFSEAINAEPDIVLGLATGSTPLPLYECLVKRNAEGSIDFSRVRTVNLDENVGLSGTHNQSYRYFMDNNLFNHINIDPANTNLPDGTAADLASECERYNAVIDKLGCIGLQLLGIGHNGHVGFNEPADVFSTRTQVVRLTESTINANSRFFSDSSEVPRFAVTMGIRDIMLARKIVMIAGAEKKDILEQALHGDITPLVPASVLQLHRDVTVILSSI